MQQAPFVFSVLPAQEHTLQGVALAVDVFHIGGDDEGILVDLQGRVPDLGVLLGVDHAEDGLALFAGHAGLHIDHGDAAVDVVQDLVADAQKTPGR